jgi:hypothetical protein
VLTGIYRMNDYWLLRYPNGDAFALALLPYDYITIYNGRLPDYEKTRPPPAFEYVIHDYRDEVSKTIINYDYEVLRPTEWETLAEFGIPVAEEKTNDDGERWLEIR